MCLKEVSHVFHFILLGAIALAFKDIVNEREKKRDLNYLKKKTLSNSACLSLQMKQTNKKKKREFFFINIFFFFLPGWDIRTVY